MRAADREDAVTDPPAGTDSPAVVRERLVGFSHLVGVLATLHGRAETVARVEKLVGQTLHHGLLTTLTREGNQPAQGQRGGTAGANLDRDLVGGATDAAAADLEGGLDVVERALEGDDRIGAGLLASLLECLVDDALGGDFLPSRRILLTSCVTSGEP